MKKITPFAFVLVALLFGSCSTDDEKVQRQEEERIDKLFSELKKISLSVSCTDSSTWTFTEIGSKACGGPSGYIAYSTTIDTANFLKKVKEYSKVVEDYNKKWGIVSDCTIVQPPTKVVCKDGLPTFVN